MLCVLNHCLIHIFILEMVKFHTPRCGAYPVAKRHVFVPESVGDILSYSTASGGGVTSKRDLCHVCVFFKYTYRTEALQTMKTLEKILRFNILPPQNMCFFLWNAYTVWIYVSQFVLHFFNSCYKLTGVYKQKIPVFLFEKTKKTTEQKLRVEQKSSAGAIVCVPPKKTPCHLENLPGFWICCQFLCKTSCSLSSESNFWRRKKVFSRGMVQPHMGGNRWVFWDENNGRPNISKKKYLADRSFRDLILVGKFKNWTCLPHKDVFFFRNKNFVKVHLQDDFISNLRFLCTRRILSLHICRTIFFALKPSKNQGRKCPGDFNGWNFGVDLGWVSCAMNVPEMDVKESESICTLQ